MMRHLFRLHEGEGAKVVHFVVLALLLQAGLAVGISAADSLFLVRLGADRLPVIYLLTPLMMLVYIGLYTWLQGWLGVGRTLVLTLGGLALAGAAIATGLGRLEALATLTGLPPSFFLYGVKLYTVLWFIGLYTLLWNFIDAYFDIVDAKRLFAFFTGGIALGTLLGGGLTAALVRVMPVGHLFYVWSGLALVALPWVLFLRARYRPLVDDEPGRDGGDTGWTAQLGRLGSTLRDSRFAQLLIAVFLVLLVVTTLCEFQYMTVFEQGRSEAEVAALFGRLYAGVNLLNLVINLVLFNRLVAWIGVRNTALIQPVVYAVTFSVFLLDYGFGAAVLGFVAYQGIQTSIEYNNQNFLFNALPRQAKAQVRTFIEGLCEPVAVAVAGLFLLGGAARLRPEMMSTLALAGVALLVGLVLWLRAEYTRAMLQTLRASWLDFSGVCRERLAHLAGPDLATVRAAAHLPDAGLPADPAGFLEALRILSWSHPTEAAETLAGYLDRAKPPAQAAAGPLVAHLLSRGESPAASRLALWQAHTERPVSPRLLEEFGRFNLLNQDDVAPLARASDPDLRAVAAVSLWNTWRVDGNLQCMQLTRDLLAGEAPARRAALRVIGKSGRGVFAHLLVDFLHHPDPGLRREALDAMDDLATGDAGRLVAPLLAFARRHRGEERRRALGVLVRVADPPAVEPLLRLADDLGPDERRRAESAILRNGLQSVPSLVAVLREGAGGQPCRSLAARCLARLAFAQFEAMAPVRLQAEIDRAHAMAAAQIVLERAAAQDDTGATALLARLYADLGEAQIDLVLELLTLGGRLPDFEMMASALRSNNPKDRGNALETIEQACPRRVHRRLLPLIDGRPAADLARFIEQRLGLRPSLKDVLESALQPQALPLERACALQAAWALRGQTPPPVPALREALHRILRAEAHTGVQDIAFELLSRLQGETASPLPVERAAALAGSAFFDAFDVSALVELAGTAREETHPEGGLLLNPGQDGTEILVVLEGRWKVRETILSTGEVWDGPAGSSAGLVALKRGRLLRVPRDELFRIASTRPRVGVAWLRQLHAGAEEVAHVRSA